MSGEWVEDFNNPYALTPEGEEHLKIRGMMPFKDVRPEWMADGRKPVESEWKTLLAGGKTTQVRLIGFQYFRGMWGDGPGLKFEPDEGFFSISENLDASYFRDSELPPPTSRQAKLASRLQEKFKKIEGKMKFREQLEGSDHEWFFEKGDVRVTKVRSSVKKSSYLGAFPCKGEKCKGSTYSLFRFEVVDDFRIEDCKKFIKLRCPENEQRSEGLCSPSLLSSVWASINDNEDPATISFDSQTSSLHWPGNAGCDSYPADMHYGIVELNGILQIQDKKFIVATPRIYEGSLSVIFAYRDSAKLESVANFDPNVMAVPTP